MQRAVVLSQKDIRRGQKLLARLNEFIALLDGSTPRRRRRTPKAARAARAPHVPKVRAPKPSPTTA